jgi:hypothetical protein
MDKEIDDRSNRVCIQCALKTGKRCGMAFCRANLIWYLRSEGLIHLFKDRTSWKHNF